ncbi:MAG TPA: DUF3105 domain-containing protein, partial [Nakamurella sp.]|nr:DUF3105 domain-containing protein [Nakamurella sp.]
VGIGWVVFSKASDYRALDACVPSAENKDPSTNIADVYANAAKYKQALHVQATQRVDYDMYPPVGGPHDGFWAACNGVVYTKPVRDENMVHTLEHGAVWIAYNPNTIAAGDLDILKGLVQDQQFMVMSPYPALTDHPISLQAWGHRLQVDSASDPRVKEFITALRRNPYVYPEIGATCEQPSFPTADPPPFDASPRGSDAIPLDGGTLAPATSEMNGAPAAPTASGSGAPTQDPATGSDHAGSSGTETAAASTPGSAGSG